jgi:DNA-binding SARP family transcriptional activator
MSNLKISLLGAPQIELDGTIVPLRRSKALALLIYLAVNGRPQRRDTLATLLWPDSNQSTGRSSL